MRRVSTTVVLALTLAACRGSEPPHLAIGAAAPDFSLPGIDGKSHALAEYADSRVLAIVFTGNSCPASQQYEARIRRLHEDYRGKGVSVVAINPNAPAAMQFADLGYSDVGETLDDMRRRATDRQLPYPYLSDGHDQALSKKFGVTSPPPCLPSSMDARSKGWQRRLRIGPSRLPAVRQWPSRWPGLTSSNGCGRTAPGSSC
jgi:peroxiredoxin